MNTSHAFRSHLMQQFAAQARTQSRPPLALLGLFSDENEQINNCLPHIAAPQHSQTLLDSNISSIRSSFPSQSCNVKRRHTDSEIIRSSRTVSIAPKNFSDLIIQEPAVAPQDTNSFLSSSQSSTLKLSEEFQNLLQTRRSVRRLTSLKQLPALYEREEDYWIDALDRAVRCGYEAPNSKREEPFTFKRMVAPSQATERLSEIAFQVDLREKLADSSKSVGSSISVAMEHAERKREKWSQIPAFLVTTVSEESLDHNEDSISDQYDQFPYVPPQTEQALENYASACAAVQNVLLSLHSEQIAAKWTTGPVIRTPAFRDLVHVEPNDRVVGLIMVGDGSESTRDSSSRRQRRSQRPPHENILVDL